jgi:H+-transporting ATPase
MNRPPFFPKLDASPAGPVPAGGPAPPGPSDLKIGLTKSEVALRRRQFGFNEVLEKKTSPLWSFFKKFWGLTAWMLELIILLSLILRKQPDAVIVGLLLLVNAVVGFLEERKASRAVDILKTRLLVFARTLRDGAWTLVPARELVPGDVVHVRIGDFVPADMEIADGTLSVDQSALTGESLPLEKAAGDVLPAGAVLKRGEATGVVILTGAATRYGKMTQLVQFARPKLHMEEVVSKLVKSLLILIGGLLILTSGISILRGFSLLEILPLLLVLLMSAIPVALPVMFTVSMAVGARELARRNVLITRLSATEDAATMDVLCVDKTGTLTLNELSIARLIPWGSFSEPDVIFYGALASQEANQDPLDQAFIELAGKENSLRPADVRESFTPFDPRTRRTEALIRRNGKPLRVLKGAVAEIAGVCGLDAPELGSVMDSIDGFSRKGYKTVAVAMGEDAPFVFVGLAALSDSLRPDSKALIQELRGLGVSIKMLTGDALPIAQEVAANVGIGAEIIPMSDLRSLLASDQAKALTMIERSAGFAEVFPEDKYLIVQLLQAGRHVVGMTGDGVNDAPALKQAEVGIAVQTAADAAKASASVVLTSAGLGGIVDLVKNGRKVYQRIQTWILNKIMRTILKSSFVVGVFLISGDFVISAFAMVLLLLMTDFVKISLSTDRVRWSPDPDNWNIKKYVTASAVLGFLMVLESLALLTLGLKIWHLGPAAPMVRTFSFEILFFSAVTSIFVVRERRHFWSSAPSRVLSIVILIDILAGTSIATLGFPGSLEPLPLSMTALVIGFNIVFSLFVNDAVKILLLRMLKPARTEPTNPPDLD